MPRAALTYRDPADQIGTGSFKRVFKATLRLPGSPRPTTVAALQVRDGDVAAEVAVLLKLGKPPRLVTFIGQCRSSAADPRSDMLLIAEFAPRGDLHSVVLDMADDDLAIPFQHKQAMIQQIAAGMEGLADQTLFHRDLALRNVLVFELDMADVTATSVKVSDFGLTVNSHTATHVCVQGGPLPTRYLSPESLQRGRHSEKTDVWAFGVMCWELIDHRRHDPVLRDLERRRRHRPCGWWGDARPPRRGVRVSGPVVGACRQLLGQKGLRAPGVRPAWHFAWHEPAGALGGRGHAPDAGSYSCSCANVAGQHQAIVEAIMEEYLQEENTITVGNRDPARRRTLSQSRAAAPRRWR